MQMAKPSDHPGFKKILDEWNQKLYESGFRDIENTKHGERVLKKSGTVHRYERLDEVTKSARAEYFRQLSIFVSETKFDNQVEQQILELYSQGFSQIMIQRMLKIEGHRCKIYYPIYRWLREWGLK